MSKLVQFTGVHFSNLNSNSYEVTFKCLHALSKVKFGANNQGL